MSFGSTHEAGQSDHAWNLKRSRKYRIRNEGELQFGLSRRIRKLKYIFEHKLELEGQSNLQESQVWSRYLIAVNKDDFLRSKYQKKPSSDPTDEIVLQQPYQASQFARLKRR